MTQTGIEETYGRWTVLRFFGRTETRQPLWWCRCECGLEKAVLAQHLQRGRSRGCAKCMAASKSIDDRRCRWCKRKGFARRGVGNPRAGLDVTGGECEACKTQARRRGRDADGRPIAKGTRKVVTS